MEKMEEIKIKADYCLSCNSKPCRNGCPLNNDITEFIKCIKKEEYKEAYNVLTKTSVLSSVCGRVCPHTKQCEGSCVRGIKNVPVSIGELEAFIGDMAIKENWKLPKNKENIGKTIAIVGSGPAGLTAAAFLTRNGFSVTIYEKNDKLGGILYKGIPDFRLDKEILEKNISKIIDLGIDVKFNYELGKDYTLENLKQKYNYVLLAFGANISNQMRVPGEQLDGVYGGNELLEEKIKVDFKGKKVAVIGAGNVAMDTARTINKLGAEKTYIIYRRSEKQMTAEVKEIQEAKKEGIEFLLQRNIVKIEGKNKVEKIELVKTELVKRENEDREVPVNIEESNFYLDVDIVVRAVGSRTELDLLHKLDLELDKYGYILVDENYKTSQENVYATGDLIGSKSTVAWAARSGRNAADAICSLIK